MNFKNDFDMFVGGKSGVFKGVKIDKNKCIAKNIQNLVSITKDHEVTTMSWGDDDDEKDVLIGCGSAENRSVKVYDSQHSAFSTSFSCNVSAGKIRGISRYNDCIITAVESGDINLWRRSESIKVIKTNEDLHAMRHNKFNKNIIATGGKEHPLQLYDLEQDKVTFKEKNVRHDWLEMRVPVWVSDIGFLPDSSKIATCSRYGYVRLYDPLIQKRPVINIEVKDQALTTLAIAPKENHIVVGSGKGIMNLVDLRKPGKVLNTYKGFVGGITAISCPKNNPYIVSVGLDRYLRVHNINTKELLQKVYLTSRLSSMVLRSEFVLKQVESKENITNDENIQIIDDSQIKNDTEYDEMFNNMPVISNDENDRNYNENIIIKKRKIVKIKK
ncbi:GSCOCG00008790001-RA-CDS [Cotesia congregata]|uniref:Similar to WDR74: WD repeat-containing protein 74 (Bos taurus) n=1 Tax=Cotesia congregata TaxID=51543 RepID=A0A8J2MXV8_COTCN|nr:GSCOCG00008790001-RA-CDS [Cotesia congregata]CAG5104478.1 Similar to WDR74: WD repeat-containing protein 74 (Bos taurus) [Cotesia congregata]